MVLCVHVLCAVRVHSDTRFASLGGVSPRWRSKTGPREERRFLTMEDTEDSVAGPPQCTCFVELSAERSRRLATLRK